MTIISNLDRAWARLPKTASVFTEDELRDRMLFNPNANLEGAASETR